MPFCQNSEGRNLSTIFYQLPTRRELRDYYAIIKVPIDIKRIKVLKPEQKSFVFVGDPL